MSDSANVIYPDKFKDPPKFEHSSVQNSGGSGGGISGGGGGGGSGSNLPERVARLEVQIEHTGDQARETRDALRAIQTAQTDGFTRIETAQTAGLNRLDDRLTTQSKSNIRGAFTLLLVLAGGGSWLFYLQHEAEKKVETNYQNLLAQVNELKGSLSILSAQVSRMQVAAAPLAPPQAPASPSGSQSKNDKQKHP